MDLHPIFPRLFVGSFPQSRDDVDLLAGELGVTAVINLQQDEDLQRLKIEWPELQSLYAAASIEVRRIAVRDFDQDDLRKMLPECVRALNELLGGGHTVYVHCTVGAGRSPSVIVAWLHWSQGWELDQAVRHVQSCRPCCPDVKAIQLAGEERPRRKAEGGRRNG